MQQQQKAPTLPEIEQAARNCIEADRNRIPLIKAIESLKTTHGWADEYCREVERRANELIAQQSG